MWTCPTCGRSYAIKNQWHSCVDTTVDDHLAGRTELAVAIYSAVVEALTRAGEYRVHPQQTRIAFISKMTFAGLKLARNWADLTVILPDPLASTRVRKLELFGPSSWAHGVRLYSPEDVDHELSGWLAEALRRGDQETLDHSKEVQPLTGRQLGIFWTGFAATVDGDRIQLPRYVAQALALVQTVAARVGGVEYETDLGWAGDVAFLDVDPTTGLGDGDETDGFLRGVH